jgi:CheY-like chemotaxis protein
LRITARIAACSLWETVYTAPTKALESKPVEPSLLILLAEDQALIGLHLQEVLEEAGFAVHHALSGGDAMAALAAHRDDLAGVVTDIQLGSGPTGWDVARRARELNPRIPMVYLSGDSAHEHTSQGVPDSMMIQKPFAPAQIVIAISTLLNAVPPQEPSAR